MASDRSNTEAAARECCDEVFAKEGCNTYVVATSQILIVLSLLALAIRSSPGKNLTVDTVCSCPRRVFPLYPALSHCCVSHTLMLKSDEHVANVADKGHEPAAL